MSLAVRIELPRHLVHRVSSCVVNCSVAQVEVDLAADGLLKGVRDAARTARQPMLGEPLEDGFTLEELAGTGRRVRIAELERDRIGYLDADAVNRVREVGVVRAIAASRPHMLGVEFEWNKALGGGIRHAAEAALWGQSA
jgi:hypothetical protein